VEVQEFDLFDLISSRCTMADSEKPQEVSDNVTATPGPDRSDSTDLKKNLAIDTVHNDEALKVLATYDGEETWDEKEEKLVRRKIDRRLLPILCATYGLVCLRLFYSIVQLHFNAIMTDYLFLAATAIL